jgi:hypothetical protein
MVKTPPQVGDFARLWLSQLNASPHVLPIINPEGGSRMYDPPDMFDPQWTDPWRDKSPGEPEFTRLTRRIADLLRRAGAAALADRLECPTLLEALEAALIILRVLQNGPQPITLTVD